MNKPEKLDSQGLRACQTAEEIQEAMRVLGPVLIIQNLQRRVAELENGLSSKTKECNEFKCQGCGYSKPSIPRNS